MERTFGNSGTGQDKDMHWEKKAAAAATDRHVIGSGNNASTAKDSWEHLQSTEQQAVPRGSH